MQHCKRKNFLLLSPLDLLSECGGRAAARGNSCCPRSQRC